MKIHGMCLIKNEADIIALTLSRALAWCDAIYVMDNGSSDATREIVHDLSLRHPQIILCPSSGDVFDNGLRARIFQQYRHLARPGDWWCRLDADEIYIDEPRRFLSAVPRQDHVVWAIHLQYYLTAESVPASYEPDTSGVPVMTEALLPRHYLANSSETRFFRHRDGLVWNEGAWPLHLGVVHPRRIRLRHYQYRSPEQIVQRLQTRRQARDFSHIRSDDWRNYLEPAGGLHVEDGSENYIIDEAALPPHLDSPLRQGIKRIMHGLHLWS